MSDSRWVCPHCEHAAFITAQQNMRTGSVTCAIDSADGQWLTYVRYIVCPNPACKLTTILLAFGNGDNNSGYVNWHHDPSNMRLRPVTYARPMPEYVPAAIRDDYREACAILDLSPKAAATLARRALQGMIRGFHGITRPTLAREIEELRDRVDPLTWQAIDAVRGVGNIGAHMERDIDTIIDVEPDEAVRLVRLIELLVKEWYVARHQREQDLAAIVALNASKQEQRKRVSAEASAVDGAETANVESPDAAG